DHMGNLIMIWSDKYKTGINKIDQQHEKWLSLIEKLSDSLLIGKTDENLDSIFEEAFEYTQTHFAFEEKLMEQHGYPAIEKHRELHQQMIDRLKYIKDRIDEINQSESKHLLKKQITRLSKIFYDWLIIHIEHEDQKYVPFIKEQPE
ncbi:MAG: hypothetical protein EP297_15060, partial [Gammaproteobacteria bacterium]